MKQEQIHDALTELPESLIASTAQARAKKRVLWGPWVALAACACLALVMGWQLSPMFQAHSEAPENAGADYLYDSADKFYGYSQDGSSTEASVLTARVVEVHERSILVAPLEGEVPGSDSRILITVDAGSGYAVGDVVQIRYDGQILETWPLQLGRVYGIERIAPAE